MKKDLTVQELANIWQVTVNTTWKRLKNLQKTLSPDDNGLIIGKKRVNNREITVISISEKILQEYTVNNPVNNGDYEELLTDDNVNNPVNNSQKSIDTQDLINKVMDYSEQMNITVNNIHKDYSERLLTLQEQLFNEKSKIPLLEDKASREGMYLKEINELKAAASDTEKQNNKKQRLFVAVLSAVFILWVITLIFLIYTLLNPRTITETIIKEVPKEVILKK